MDRQSALVVEKMDAVKEYTTCLMQVVWFGKRSIRAMDKRGNPLMGDSCFQASEDTIKHLDSVYRFLSEADCWEFDANSEWSEKDFIMEFNNFRRERSLDMSAGWKEELYSYAFQEFKLEFVTKDWHDPRGEADNMSHGIKCIKGITRKM